MSRSSLTYEGCRYFLACVSLTGDFFFFSFFIFSRSKNWPSIFFFIPDAKNKEVSHSLISIRDDQASNWGDIIFSPPLEVLHFKCLKSFNILKLYILFYFILNSITRQIVVPSASKTASAIHIIKSGVHKIYMLRNVLPWNKYLMELAMLKSNGLLITYSFIFFFLKLKTEPTYLRDQLNIILTIHLI